MNDPEQVLSLFLRGALGRSGRKRARKAASFVLGNKGLVTAGGLITAAGVAWGIFDSLKQSPAQNPPFPGGASAGVPPPVPDVFRVVRLAVSAARADGSMTDAERAVILQHAREAGIEAEVERELTHPHPLADIVRGVTDTAAREKLYMLAFAVIRADESVTGAERIYLAQLAHQLGLDAAAAARLEATAAAGIDS